MHVDVLGRVAREGEVQGMGRLDMAMAEEDLGGDARATAAIA